MNKAFAYASRDLVFADQFETIAGKRYRIVTVTSKSTGKKGVGRQPWIKVEGQGKMDTEGIDATQLAIDDLERQGYGRKEAERPHAV